MEDLKEIKDGIVKICQTNQFILEANKSFEKVIIDKFKNADNEIKTLWESYRDKSDIISRMSEAISSLKDFRIENKSDIKELSSKIEHLREEVNYQMQLTLSSKDEVCKETHKKLDASVDTKIVDAHFSFSKEFSAFKKYVDEVLKNSGLSADNKILNFKGYLFLSGLSLMTSVVTFFITRYAFK